MPRHTHTYTNMQTCLDAANSISAISHPLLSAGHRVKKSKIFSCPNNISLAALQNEVTLTLTTTSTNSLQFSCYVAAQHKGATHIHMHLYKSSHAHKHPQTLESTRMSRALYLQLGWAKRAISFSISSCIRFHFCMLVTSMLQHVVVVVVVLLLGQDWLKDWLCGCPSSSVASFRKLSTAPQHMWHLHCGTGRHAAGGRLVGRQAGWRTRILSTNSYDRSPFSSVRCSPQGCRLISLSFFCLILVRFILSGPLFLLLTYFLANSHVSCLWSNNWDAYKSTQRVVARVTSGVPKKKKTTTTWRINKWVEMRGPSCCWASCCCGGADELQMLKHATGKAYEVTREMSAKK